MKRMTKAVLSLLGGWLLMGSALAADLTVSNPWVREAPPGARALGAFMVVSNAAGAEHLLVGARSAAFDKVELHRTYMEGGMAKMAPVPGIAIPAKGEIAFAPGGLHLMLIGPREALKAGDKLEITLEFKDGTTLPVSFDVRKGEGMAHGGMDHGHGGMDHSGHHM